MTDPHRAVAMIVAIFATGDVGAIGSVIAPNYVDHQGLGGREMRGPEGFRQVVAAARQCRDLRVTIEDIVAAHDKAAVRLRWEGSDPSSGKTVTREALDFLRFEQGRLVEHWGAEVLRRET